MFDERIKIIIQARNANLIIDTVDGKVAYDVKAGTQTDTRVRLRGKGVPSLRDKDTRGDHYVTLVVQVPEKLSKEAKDILKQFDEKTGDSLGAADRVLGNSDKGPNDGGGKKKKGFFK